MAHIFFRSLKQFEYGFGNNTGKVNEVDGKVDKDKGIDGSGFQVCNHENSPDN